MVTSEANQANDPGKRVRVDIKKTKIQVSRW